MVTQLALLRSHIIPLGHLVEMASLQARPYPGTSKSNIAVALMWDTLNLAVTYLMNPRNKVDAQSWSETLREIVQALSENLSSSKKYGHSHFAKLLTHLAVTEFHSKLGTLIGYQPSMRHKWLREQLADLEACPHYPFSRGISTWRTLVRNMTAEELASEYKALKVPLTRVSRVDKFASSLGTERVPVIWKALEWHFANAPAALVGGDASVDSDRKLVRPGVEIVVQSDGTLLVKATKEKLAVIKSKSPAVKGKPIPKAIQEKLAPPSRVFMCLYTELAATVEQAHAWLDEPTENTDAQLTYDKWVQEQEKVWTTKELKKHFSEEQIELIRKSLTV